MKIRVTAADEDRYRKKRQADLASFDPRHLYPELSDDEYRETHDQMMRVLERHAGYIYRGR